MTNHSITQTTLTELPPHALTAFSIRLARRVQPLFELPQDIPSRDDHLDALDQAIATGEGWSQGNTVSEEELLWALNAADRAAAAIDNFTWTKPLEVDSNWGGTASWESQVIRYAARTAGFALWTTIGYATQNAPRDAFAAVLASGAVTAKLVDREAAAEARQIDIDALFKLRAVDGTFPNVNWFEALGELWPNGAPEWYCIREAALRSDLAQIRSK